MTPKELGKFIDNVVSVTMIEPTLWYIYNSLNHIAVKYTDQKDRDIVRNKLSDVCTPLWDSTIIIDKDKFNKYYGC